MQFELESTFASQQQQQQQQSDSKYRSSFFSKGSVIKRWFKEAKKTARLLTNLKMDQLVLFSKSMVLGWIALLTIFLVTVCSVYFAF